MCGASSKPIRRAPDLTGDERKHVVRSTPRVKWWHKRDQGRCVVPRCWQYGKHLHHIVYRSKSKGLRWATSNTCLLCTDHHRLEHAGEITITGNADVAIVVTGDVDRLKFRV